VTKNCAAVVLATQVGENQEGIMVEAAGVECGLVTVRHYARDILERVLEAGRRVRNAHDQRSDN
jgi:hypothetical protein